MLATSPSSTAFIKATSSLRPAADCMDSSFPMLLFMWCDELM
jgi:hypothetical protein